MGLSMKLYLISYLKNVQSQISATETINKSADVLKSKLVRLGGNCT